MSVTKMLIREFEFKIYFKLVEPTLGVSFLQAIAYVILSEGGWWCTHACVLPRKIGGRHGQRILCWRLQVWEQLEC